VSSGNAAGLQLLGLAAIAGAAAMVANAADTQQFCTLGGCESLQRENIIHDLTPCN
jgi:hypothetical protein